MSVYLGQDKVGVAYLKQANMYEDNRTIMQDDIYTPWTRPEGWPDLDSLNLEMSGDFSFIYMTFRTGHVDDIFNCGWTLISGYGIRFDYGTIENGEFVSSLEEPILFASNTTYTMQFTPDNNFEEGYVVIKITGRFSRFYLKDYTRAAADGGGTIKYYMQPVLERIWYVPELTVFYDGNSTSNAGNGTTLLRRDKINNGNGNALTSLGAAWCWCFTLESLDISGLKTQNVTSMSGTFQYCKRLEYLDVSHFNTAKVTSMSQMFYICQRIKQLDFRNWVTTSLTNFNNVFYYCEALKQILGLENIYTNNVTSFSGLFYWCQSLQDLSGITNWNTSKVTNLGSMFYYFRGSHFNGDISNWDVSKVTSVGALFYCCYNLEYIIFPRTTTGTLTGSLASLFANCYNLQEVDLTWMKPITNAVTSIGSIFYHCRSLTEINIPEGWDITGCIASESCYRIFADCYSLQKITGISNWDMSNYNYSLAYAFENDYCLKELDISNWSPHPTTIYQAFYQCRSLEEIDLTGWNWGNMTGTALASTFAACHSLKSIKGIEHMGDSGNITSFASTFSECFSLISIPNISTWNPAKVTTCSSMFNNCHSLQSLTISNWSLPKCTSLGYMFRYCYNMHELELTGWSIPAVTDAGYIFSQMYSLAKFSGLPIAITFRAQELYSLPEDQWARVFTQLPTVSSKTINMTTNVINKLTSTTKAIATNKGWTLAN